jgi:outer membrane lipoprotein LolB
VTRLILIATLALLGACSSLQQQPPKAEQPRQLHNWQLSGKLGLRGEQLAESAYIRWQQCDDNFAIKLNGPLGTGALHISGDSQLTQIRSKDQQISTPLPRQWLWQNYGWDLPLDYLPHWLQGLPATPDTQIDHHGFTESGWIISYPRWQQLDGYQLPAKIIAQHPKLKVTFIIKDWQLSPACP